MLKLMFQGSRREGRSIATIGNEKQKITPKHLVSMNSSVHLA